MCRLRSQQSGAPLGRKTALIHILPARWSSCLVQAASTAQSVVRVICEMGRLSALPVSPGRLTDLPLLTNKRRHVFYGVDSQLCSRRRKLQ